MSFSSNDMYTGDVYLKNKPTWDDEDTGWKAELIVSMLKRNQVIPADIVEVGCGRGGILKEIIRLLPDVKKLRGYDISGKAIALAKERENHKLNFMQLDYANSNEPYTDVLLIIDVLEHIDDYYGFLNKIKNKSRYKVFHIPLDISCRNIMKPHTILLQRELVGHIHYFTKETVEWALKDTGYVILDWIYTKPALDVQPAGNFKSKIKKTLRKISFAINKDWSAKMWGGYSVMILAE